MRPSRADVLPRMRPVFRALWLAALAAACGPGPTVRPTPIAPARAWFDSPAPGTVLAAGETCQIMAHGASPVGIRTVEFSINGMKDERLGTTGGSDSIVTYSRDCSDFVPGEYVLRLRVRDTANQWSESAEAGMLITDGERPTPSPPAEAVATPTRTPVSSGGSVAIETVSSNVVYAGEDSCGPAEVTFTARATSPGPITVVVLFYRVEPGGPVSYKSAVMEPIGGGGYRRTIDINSAVDGPAEGVLHYQAVVQQADGDTSIRTPLLSDIAVQPCGQVRTSSQDTCSRYTSQRSCESRGCKWVLLPGIFPVYACGNP